MVQTSNQIHPQLQSSLKTRIPNMEIKYNKFSLSSSCSNNGAESKASVSLNSSMNSAIAGYAAGFVGVVLGHPLDSLKVWAQTASQGKNKHFSHSSIGSPRSSGLSRPTSRNISSMAASNATSVSTRQSNLALLPLCRKKGANLLRITRALYSGATVPLFTVGIVQSINFTMYDGIRRVLHHQEHPGASSKDYLHKDSMKNVALAGFLAGTGLAFCTSPLIMIKTNQQISGNGFREAVQETLRPRGKLNLSGCFVGIYPHLASETMGRALYYFIYESCKRQTAEYRIEQGLSPTISIIERMGAAALAGIACWSAIYPLDSLRNRMYSQAGQMNASGTIRNPLSTWEMARTMYREKALYRGFSLTVLRAGPVAALVLPVYDLVLESLSS